MVTEKICVTNALLRRPRYKRGREGYLRQKEGEKERGEGGRNVKEKNKIIKNKFASEKKSCTFGTLF